MTMQNLLKTIDAMPEDKREALIAHMLQRIEVDALEDKRQQDAARRRAAMLAKYPFLDSEYVRSIEFHHDGRLKSIDLCVWLDSLCRIEMRPGDNGKWRVVQCWESDDEFTCVYDDGTNVARFSKMVALMQRIESKVSTLEIIA